MSIQTVSYAASANLNLIANSDCVFDWMEFGIIDDDVDENSFKTNYGELIKKYGDNIMYIQVTFAYSKLKQINKNLRIQCRSVMTKLSKIENRKFKNPYLLLLGHFITNPITKQIDMDNFNLAVSIIPQIVNYKLFPADLLRYHRLWQSI